jgi:hypothetical protein
MDVSLPALPQSYRYSTLRPWLFRQSQAATANAIAASPTKDIGVTATEMVRAIVGRDYEGFRAAVKGADTEAVSVLLAAILTDVLSDVSAEHAAAGRGVDVSTLLLMKMTMVRRGEEF